LFCVLELASKAEIVLDSFVERLDLRKVFGRVAPLQVDLGCGDGSFLFCLAQRHPDKNFLGIERLAYRVETASRQANKVDNMRLLRIETAYAVELLLPPQSVETFYLLFPDPWPKRRHHRRRIINNLFLNSAYRALEPNGLLRIATDHFEYFQQMERLAITVAEEQTIELDCLKQSSSSRFKIANRGDDDLPETKFERRFRAAGAPIYRLSLRKISPVT
jgi:tRNA (guanine-N7-)-methyltransferase